MLISLNWIREFVDLPAKLDVRELAERFTRTTAEVEEVRPVAVEATGLIAARVLSAVDLPGTRNLHLATLDVGGGKTVETVSAAPVLHEGCNVVYAPEGASVAAFGKLTSAEVAGKTSRGMILPGEAIGIAMAVQEAIFLDDSVAPGQPLDSALFDDWVIEVDNKSITHRPDLWGHYGIAREIAAITGESFKSYPVVALNELVSGKRPAVEIRIADPVACPRYTALVFEGVPTQPAPLWMQLRLGHVGMRPISGLVDLTNYIMAELGQPMHAFDASRVDRIEVDRAAEGEKFTTLDGMERTLTGQDLMIKAGGRSVALAGVMGGLESEVSDTTTALLLESANFASATIRRTATRLALRTDASARFEKSLDPAHTVLGVQRFVALARPMYPKLKLTSTLSDAFPKPPEAITVSVNPDHVARAIGRNVVTGEMRGILKPLGFTAHDTGTTLEVKVPSFRATGDVAIEADVIEEIARYIGYNNVTPALPHVTVRRFEINALHELEQRTLRCFTGTHGYHEIHGYLWDETPWMQQLGYDPGPCVELVNPAAEGLHRLRRTLLPGLLAAVAKNRFHFPAFSLIELGSVYHVDKPEDRELRNLGLIIAQRGKNGEGKLSDQLKGALEAWAWERFARPIDFVQVEASAAHPWEHTQRTAEIRLEGTAVGRVSVVDGALRRVMDEHLSAWSVAWAEVSLNGLEMIEPAVESLDGIPAYPLVELDFSILVPKASRYARVAEQIGAFSHPLLRRTRYVDCYEGDAVAKDARSLTFRTVVADDTRTLVDDDTNAFREAFERHVVACGYEIRR